MKDEKVEYVPVTEDCLFDVAQTIAQFGMPRSIRCLRRMLFNPALKDVGDGVRGYLLRVDGRYVGIQCFYYTTMFFAQREFIGRSGCFMAVRPDFASYWFALQKKISQDKEHRLHIGNCHANVKSAMIDTGLLRRTVGPSRCEVVSFAYTSPYMKALARLWRTVSAKFPTRPRRVDAAMSCLGWVVVPVHCLVQSFSSRSKCELPYKFMRYRNFDASRFGDFWRSYISKNTGVCSARDPETMQWVFGDSVKAGMVVLIAAERAGRIEGFVVLRRYFWGKGPLADIAPGFVRYKIVDICALDNDNECLLSLVRYAYVFAVRHRGATLEYVGGAPQQERWLDPVLNVHHKLGFSTTTYKAVDQDVTDSLKVNAGWFFGPFDGERCFGHGGYIDV